MPRGPRNTVGDIVYHVLNRGNARLPIFESNGDYLAFLRVMTEAHQHSPMRTLDYCLMPNHWHLVLWPEEDRDLADFMHWLTTTHTQRWHAAYGVVGSGHLYQGRYKDFPVQDNHHYWTVCRYVERNPVRAGLVTHAEDWPWSALYQRRKSVTDGRPPLAPGPLAFPPDWLTMVNTGESEKELSTLRQCASRGSPFGGRSWVTDVAHQLNLESSLRPRGRPSRR